MKFKEHLGRYKGFRDFHTEQRSSVEELRAFILGFDIAKKMALEKLDVKVSSCILEEDLIPLGEKSINFDTVIKLKDVNFKKEEEAVILFVKLLQILSQEGGVLIDLEGVNSLTSSVAYEIFGRLVDRFGSTIDARFRFENDTAFIANTILKAFNRRKSILR